MPHIAVDFNTETSEPVGVLKIFHPGVPLVDGEIIVAYDDEMEVQARVSYDAQHDLWLAVPDWATRHDVLEHLA
jgi:hypothetical protein